MNEWINFFLLYTVVVSINKIGFHISRPETNIDMMWKIALSNPWLYSACRAFFPACGVMTRLSRLFQIPDCTEERFVTTLKTAVYWLHLQLIRPGFRPETNLDMMWKIALSNPNVDVRILAQGYFVAINSLSLLWTFNKMKYAKPCLL